MAALMIIFVGCKPTYPRIPIGAVPLAEQQRVYNFGKRQLESCITRQFIQISKKEAHEALAGVTLEEMQLMCDVLDEQNGKFIDMELIEIIDESRITNSRAYRYKTNFERNEVINEVRIWTTPTGKFLGFIVRKWSDDYPGMKYRKYKKAD